jgi:hypothetical protein
MSVLGVGALVALLSTGCAASWYIDPSFAEKLARKENKPLLLYFKSWDSTQHRNFQRDVLQSSAVSSQLTDTVNAELEFGFFADWRKRYGITQPQVCVMCAPDGKPVGTKLTVSPVPTKEQFIEWLGRMKSQAKAVVPEVRPTP